ncbi:hypothetical protein BK138_08495 [Paenibacillus rhizosphaerae]|uniref:Uncharacterized protein n=1 Tax=Paenibacillus rhizosphaerae TaxID=297318 RepID=A0A1R1F3C8_9BACL|nr:hypothetical protein [Paenibacillus rhizosphaerae]OMF58540.1 hypothetical protein BK138_08495 [Paenibacillus rhizosphaerae]
MKLEELKSKYPDLYNQVIAEAEQAERERVIALNEFAKSPGAAGIVAQAIKDGRTVAEVAVEVLNALMTRFQNQSETPT